MRVTRQLNECLGYVLPDVLADWNVTDVNKKVFIANGVSLYMVNMHFEYKNWIKVEMIPGTLRIRP